MFQTEQLAKEPQDFDYKILNPEVKLVVQQRTSEIKEKLRDAAKTAWEIGQKLVDVRSRLDYGLFDSWLKAEFEWSRRTAYNYIRVFETFDSCATVAQTRIAAKTLYLLAAPSTPNLARQEVLERASQGEAITYTKAIAIINERDKSHNSNFEEKQPGNELSPVLRHRDDDLEFESDKEEENYRHPLDFSDYTKSDDEFESDKEEENYRHPLDFSDSVEKLDELDVQVDRDKLDSLSYRSPMMPTSHESTGCPIYPDTALEADDTVLSPQDLVLEPKSKDKQLLPSLPPNPDTPPTDVPPTPAALVNLAAIAQGIPEAAITEIAIAIQKLTISQLARVIKAAANGLSDSHLEAVIQAAKQVLSKRHNEVS